VNRLHGTVTPLAAPGERYGGHLKEVALKMLERAQRIDEAAGSIVRSIRRAGRAPSRRRCALSKNPCTAMRGELRQGLPPRILRPKAS
jgi:hypothetical protein